MSNPNPTDKLASTSTSSSQPNLKTHFQKLAPADSTVHLADSTTHPILSTAQDAQTTQSLTSLSSAYLQAHDTASRMGLGQPLRVTLATKAGTTVVQTGTEVDGGEILVGSVVAPEDKIAEARVASWGVEETARRVGRVIAEGRRGGE